MQGFCREVPYLHMSARTRRSINVNLGAHFLVVVFARILLLHGDWLACLTSSLD